MNTTIYAAGFIIAFIAVLGLTPLVSRLARRNKWVDLPGGERTVHKQPTPRAGGIAIIITFLLTSVLLLLFGDDTYRFMGEDSMLASWALLLGGGTIALTGLYDDAYGLGFKKKFLFQLMVAYAMYLAGFRVEIPEMLFWEADPYMQAALGLPVTILWYIGVMNAINLVDGLDGLASGVSLISFCALGVVFGMQGNAALIPMAVIMAGALVGFLCYNFNPASIFLGDTGSLFLGFMIATYALQGAPHTDPVASLVVITLAVGYPILDTVLAFARRFLKGQSPFAPDRDHIHHRVGQLFNRSTRKAVISLYVIHGLLAMAAIAIAQVEMFELLIILSLSLIGIVVLLRQLGYMKVQRGMVLIRRRLSDQFGERVPRGQWSGDRLSHRMLDPLKQQKNNLRTEREGEREFAIHTMD